MYKEDAWYLVFTVAYFCSVALFIVTCITFGITRSTTAKFCLSHGYANSEVTWDYSRYCINRINQTDVVVPIEKVK